MPLSTREPSPYNKAHFFHMRSSTVLDNSIKSNDDSTICTEIITSARKRCVTVPRDINIFESDTVPHAFKNVPSELLTQAKQLVQEAIKNKKIFSVFGPYDKVRKGLRNRGWVEKISNTEQLINIYNKTIKTLNPGSTESVIEGDLPEKKENKLKLEAKSSNEDILHSIASHFVFNCNTDLVWALRLNQIDHRTIRSSQLINHFRKAGTFTTKSGLIRSFCHMRWFESDSDDVYPRSYIISEEHDRVAFLNDYYFTACLSLIKLVSELKNADLTSQNSESMSISNKETNNSKSNMDKIRPRINYKTKEIGESEFKIESKFVEFAINYCQTYRRSLVNKDLDKRDVVFCTTRRWEEFLRNYNAVLTEGYGIECSKSLRTMCRNICSEIQKSYFQFHLDGYHNIWIVKPAAKSRGRGIYCMSKYSDINNLLQNVTETIIVQKYIEKPLLVYNTKFDIRQWFLVTSWSPLTLWWYNDSYIRFCSQQFTLNDFNESIHLSNNSIQYKYQNGPRSEKLPANNMWHCTQFDNYLKSIGHADAWETKIVPKMKNIIIDVLLCSQEDIEDRKNSFEFYGADFMITENDLKTWILEINSSPCMAASTELTARLTQQAIEDTLKVILDYPKDHDCDTGNFELIFTQAPFSVPVSNRLCDLSIRGNAIKKPFIPNNLMTNEFRHSMYILNSQRSRSISYDSSMLKDKLKHIISISNPRSDNMMSFKRSYSIVPEINKMTKPRPTNGINHTNRYSIINHQKETLGSVSYGKNKQNHDMPVTTKKPSTIIPIGTNNKLEEIKNQKKITNTTIDNAIAKYEESKSQKKMTLSKLDNAITKFDEKKNQKRSMTMQNDNATGKYEENKTPRISKNDSLPSISIHHNSITTTSIKMTKEDRKTINNKIHETIMKPDRTESEKVLRNQSYKTLLQRSMEENRSILNKLCMKSDVKNRRLSQMIDAYLPRNQKV